MTRQIPRVLILGWLLLSGCMHESVREAADISLPLTNSAPIDLNAATAKAAAEHKIVLVDFTGSDWCGPCMKLHRDVFAQPEFESYAKSNLVFLTVDFPSKYRLPPDASATNDLLAAKFDVSAFPTLIALDGHGTKIWRHVGFFGGDPKEWITMLERVRKQ